MNTVDLFGRQYKKLESNVKVLSNGGISSINDSLLVKIDPNINNMLSLSANGLMGNGIKSTGGVMTGNLSMSGNTIIDLHPSQDISKLKVDPDRNNLLSLSENGLMVSG